MLAITYYLIGNPLVALGLALLILLCFYNVLRRQTRTAFSLWLVIVVVFIYVYVQAAEQARRYAPQDRTSTAPAGQSRN